MNSWDALAEWWLDEGSLDPVYAEEIHPWLDDLLSGVGNPLIDLGCGEGQAMRHLGRPTIGCDATLALLEHARRAGPVVQACLPELSWLRADAVGGAYAVFVLEHLPVLEPLFDEVARVTRRGGSLVVISNHPAYTAPGAGPIIDESDGEVLWRWGPYFSVAVGEEPAGADKVVFHHRPLGSILNPAAAAGWRLTRYEERGLGPAAIARSPSLAGQEMFPRLVGIRWERDWPESPPLPQARGR